LFVNIEPDPCVVEERDTFPATVAINEIVAFHFRPFR
jgi:hypothetical protein